MGTTAADWPLGPLRDPLSEIPYKGNSDKRRPR